MLNITLKKEVPDEEQASTSQQPKKRISTENENDNDTEDSSDEENSVIILDSDTEVDTETEKDTEDDEDEEEEDEDEEESEEDEDEEVSDEESADSSETDSVWSNIDEALDENITSEAAEARIIRKFEKAMIQIADNSTVKGRKILEKLLEDPSIAVHHKEELDFEESDDPARLSKLLQVFIAIHKNLANMDSENSVEHYLQILNYEPNNTSIWFDVAMKCVENADLEFAKYAFKKCENEKDSIEAHATVLYLTCDFGGCLQVLKDYQDDVGELNDKMKYLKFKIRATNSYYKKVCDTIFEEDEHYAEMKLLDQRKMAVFDERIDDLRSRTLAKAAKNDEEFMEGDEPEDELEIGISAEMNLETVCTLFCDVYDRVQAYSKVTEQLVRFDEWENRKDFLEIREAVDEMLDVVETLEEMTEKVSIMPYASARKRKRPESAKKYLSTWKRRLFVDKPIDEEVQEADDEGNTTADEDTEDEGETVSRETTPQAPENPDLPYCELAESFGLSCDRIVPIVSSRTRIERTPPPTKKCDFLNENSVLDELRSKFEGKSCTIVDYLESALLTISKNSPSHGALPENLNQVVREMYTRISYTSQLEARRFEVLNVMMMELDHPKAVDVCIKKYLSYWSKDSESEDSEDSEVEVPTADSIRKMKDQSRRLILRFYWKFLNWKDMKDETRLEHLYEMESHLKMNDETVFTSYGNFGLSDVMYQIAELEKKKRIESVKLLWKSKSFSDIADIIENDIDFTLITTDETIEMLNFWLKSLEKLKNMEKLASLMIRMLHFYIITDFREYKEKDRIEILAQELVRRMLKIDFGNGKIGVELISSLGYFLCLALKHFKSLEENWKSWKVLYRIVKAMRDIPLLEYFTTLDRIEDAHAMPSPDLDVLVKAHEVLAEEKKCGTEDYAFLLFFVDEIRKIVDDIPVLEALFEKENNWLWTNLNQELAQCLFCLFGKYSKKRRIGEDHGSKSMCPTDWKIAKRVLPTVLVQPLPMYDDKERLNHDVVDLINSKFEFLTKISDEKAALVTNFQEMLKSSSHAELDEVMNWLNEDNMVPEQEIQSLVWYAFSLNAYRQSSHEDAMKYAELYLTTQDSMTDDRLRASAWAILAHEHVHELFFLESYQVFVEWKWRIIPFRIAIDLLKNEAVIHFEMAANMYQLASEQGRFLTSLPLDDLRRKRLQDVEKLRSESRSHFDICLALAQPSADGTPPEFQWLCYFFIGKLTAKEEDADVVKVVECFYEAACGCQLAGFYYPIKVNPKKQTNFEPLEVHYQAFSTVWKYLHEVDNPPLQTLLDLYSYLKCFENGHKVVKCNYSMFSTPPEIYQTMASVISKVSTQEMENHVEGIVDEMVEKLELIGELKDMCYKAFLLICERFPHMKSHYRLAQYYIENESYDQASEQIFKNVFKRKKRDDGIFDNVVEIACNDINRSGSYCFHLERCLRVGIGLAAKLNDIHNLVSILTTLITSIGFEEDQFIEKRSFSPLTKRLLVAIEKVCENRPKSSRNTPSPPLMVTQPSSSTSQPIAVPKRPKSPNLTSSAIRSELWRLWNHISKQDKTKNEKLLKFIENRVEMIVSKVYGSVRTLKEKVAASQESMQNSAKKKMAFKRKAAFDAEAMVNNLVASAKKTVPEVALTTSQPSLTTTTSRTSSTAVSQPTTSSQPSTSKASDDVVTIDDDDEDIEILPTSSKPAAPAPASAQNPSTTPQPTITPEMLLRNPQLLQNLMAQNPQFAQYLTNLVASRK